jgi:DNA polymerase-3 subunit epsilon
MFDWLRRTPVPEFVADYQRDTPRRIDRKRVWTDLNFTVLDAETTGFRPGQDRILSIGLVPVHRGKIDVAGRRSWLVQQSNAPSNEAVKIHGIAPADSAAGMPEQQVLTELLSVLSGTVIVGHHIGFDVQMINESLAQHFRTKLRNPLLDTATLASRQLDAFQKTGYANQLPPTLEEVCSHANLPIMGRHTATGDAFTTAQFFLWLCSRFQIRHRRDLVAGDLFR